MHAVERLAHTSVRHSGDARKVVEMRSQAEDWTESSSTDTENLLPSEEDGRRKQALGGFGKRHIVVFMLFWGIFSSYAIRICMSVAAAPTGHAVQASSNHTSTAVSMSDEFSWSQTQQGMVLGAFFNGYVLSQILGGIFARRFGGRPVLGSAVLLSSLFTALTPATAHSFYLLVACRTVLGLVSGVCFPAIMTLLEEWSSPLERSSFVGFAFAGSPAGNVVALPLSAAILRGWGWRWVFYCFALLNAAWAVAFLWVVASTPGEHPSISRAELRLLCAGDAGRGAKSRIPWRRIFSCKGAWACFVAHASKNWAYYLLMTALPTYLSLSLRFNIQDAGFASSLPYVSSCVLSPLGGVAADYVIGQGLLSRVNTRKTFQILSLLLPGLLLVACGYAEDWRVALGCMVLSVGIAGLSLSGVSANYLEISHDLGGTLYSIGNTFGTVPGMVSPIVTGLILDRYGCAAGQPALCQEAYREVFWLSLAVYGVGSVVYGAFATSDNVLQ